MLHSVLRDEIAHPELRILYDTQIPMSHPVLRDELRSAIQKLRSKYNSKNRVDEFARKAELYDNEGGWYVAKVKELVKGLYNDKKTIPNNFVGQWRSVEFELIFKSVKDCEDFAILAHQAGYGKHISIKTDGSLRVEKPGEQANEVVVNYTSGNEKIIYDICKMLRGRAYVNKTCGTHVHFDFRHVGAEEATLYGKRLARCVPALRLLLPVARRNSDYCKETINNYAESGTGGSHARYAFVNMHAYKKYKSIEIRGHSGTINANKILSWIKLCEIIMSTDLNFTGKPEHRNEVFKPQDLIDQYAEKIDANLIAYINDRAKTFSVATADEAENTILEQEVPSNNMFAPKPKKKVVKKTRKQRAAEVAVAIPAGAIPAPINAPVVAAQ